MSKIIIDNKISDYVYNIRYGEQYMILKSSKVKSEVDIPMNYIWKLRDTIPNFVNYYHVNSNVGPFIPYGDEYRTVSGTYHHIFMEQVQGLTLADCINVLSMDELYGIVLQVFMALCQGKSVYGFEHGDLHCYNIIVRRLEEPIVIHYTELSTSITVRHIAVLIDYGYSSTNSIKPPSTICVNDIYKLYASIIYVLSGKGKNYKNTLFYEYLVNVVKELKLEDDYGAMETWSALDFDLIPMESNIHVPITINDLINEINKLSYYTPDSFNIEGYKSYMPDKTHDIHIPIEKHDIIDTTIHKMIVPNILMDNISRDNIISVNYWNNYAVNVAIILLIQNGLKDEYINNAKKILETSRVKYILKDIYREFFRDTLSIDL